MKTTIRIPRAPTKPQPDLATFLEPFHVHFLRSEGRHALDRYLTGLLSELPNKNCDTIAASIPGTSEQQLQGLLSTTGWDQVISIASVSIRCFNFPAWETPS